MPHVGTIHQNPEVVKEAIIFFEFSMVRLTADAQPLLEVWLRASCDGR